MARPSLNSKIEGALTDREMRKMKIIGIAQLALCSVGAWTIGKTVKNKFVR